MKSADTSLSRKVRQMLPIRKPRSYRTLNILARIGFLRAEVLAPEELSLETGRLVQMLVMHPEGLGRNELLKSFYPGFESMSDACQESHIQRIESIIKRARERFRLLELQIVYFPAEKVWRVVPAEGSPQLMSMAIPQFVKAVSSEGQA